MLTSPAPHLVLIAGLATTAHAACPNHAPGTHAPGAHASMARAPSQLVPAQPAGVLYVNLATGERTLTRYADPDALPEIRRYTPASSPLFDYWMSLDRNPCWDNPEAPGFAFTADAPSDSTGPSPITEPIVGFDFGDLPFDSQIHGIVIQTGTLQTENTDSDGDGTLDTGYDATMVYYDALSEGNRTSIAPPTAAVRIQAIPGNRGEIPTGYSTYDLILDFGGSWFELGDSDSANRGDLWLPGAAQGYDFSSIITTLSCGPSCSTATTCICTTVTTPNTNPDGLADFQYLQYYSFYNTDDKVTDVSTFIGLAAPNGDIIFTTYTTVLSSCTPTTNTPSGCGCTVTVTVTDTIYTPDELPQGQSAFEGFGVGALGTGADTTNLDWSAGGCCFWFGGLDCAGFLDQLDQPDPPLGTELNFVPYSQIANALLSDAPPQVQCDQLDFAPDGYLDNADISAFVSRFLIQDPAVDLNADGVVDNGDIRAFVQLFLACTG